MIRIISYNIEYGKRINEIYDWINSIQSSPDIICFQEFPIDELENLKEVKIFKKPGFAFVSGLKKKGVAHGQLTMFNSEKFNLINSIEIDLGLDHAEKFYKRFPTRRSALITVFNYKKELISLTNVHLSAAAFNSRRRDQVDKVINYYPTNCASIIAGDFNYTSLVWGNVLIEHMNEFKFKLAGEKMITNKYKGIISQQLDYIFYKEIKHIKTEVFELPYSDHFPIISDFEYNA